MNALTDSQTRLYDYRKSMIAVNRSFASMDPLLLKTIRLSLNAEIASAHVGEAGKPFGIVVRELAYMGDNLAGLIKGIEEEFSKVVDAVAKWITIERRLQLYLKAYRLANEGIEDDALSILYSVDNLSLYNDKSLAALHETNKIFTSGSAQYNLLGNIISCRNQILEHMLALIEMTERLSGLLDKVNMVAVRQSHFVAVSALIESAQVHDVRGQIKTIALEIQTLSKEIHGVENSAKNNILSVASLASNILSKIK